MQQFKDQFSSSLAEALPGQAITLERPKNGALGDLAFPCFRAAKALGRNPAQLAQELASSLALEGAELVAAGPYLNLRLLPETRARVLLEALLGETPYGSAPQTGQTVLSFASLALANSNFAGGVTPSDPQRPPAAFEVAFSTDDVAAAFAHATAAGAIPVSPPKQKPWGQTVAYVRDLNGNLVELCTPMS